MSGLPTPKFTLEGARRGVWLSLPLAISGLGFGAAFGVQAGEARLSWLEAMLMSGLMFAGASQFIALQMWSVPPALAALLLATFVVNSRHLLYGAALHAWLSGLPRLRVYGLLGLMTDSTWMLTMREIRAGRTDCAFMVGSGLIIYVAWLASTAAGLGFRNQIADPASFGLDFMLPAFFVALMIGMWRGRADLLPGLAAAAVAVGVHKLGGGHWYILAGALTGCAVGAWRHGC